MKEEILFSSLTDFIAYLTIGLYSKIKLKKLSKKLVNNYYELLVMYNQIFKDTMGMRSEGLEELLSVVKERE